MIEILSSLEPRHEKRGVIFKELDEFTEIIFINKGIVSVGFELNNQRFESLKAKKIVIADHGCTFNHNCHFSYKAVTILEGYAIRKLQWIRILSKYPVIGN